MSRVLTGTGYCSRCGERLPIERRGTNHVFHLALSALTAGLWLPAWGFCALFDRPWRCTGCGMKLDRPAEVRAIEGGKPWIVRHIEWYRTLSPWAFTWRIAVEGFLVAIPIGMLCMTFVDRGLRDLPRRPEDLFLLAVVIAPPIETIVCQMAPIAIARRLKASFWLQVGISTALFAAGHFLEGITVGVAAGVVGGIYHGFTYARWAERSHWTAFWTTAVAHAIHNFLCFAPALLIGRGG